MTLNSSQAFYLLVDDKGIASMSMTLLELYEKKRDSDGFLYMSYASQGNRNLRSNFENKLTQKVLDNVRRLLTNILIIFKEMFGCQ